DYFPLFFWIHIAIVVLGIWAFFRMRKLRSSWSEVFAAFRPLPLKLIGIGAVVVIATAVSGSNVKFDLGSLPDGTAVHSKSWSERDGKFWLSINKQPQVEISESQYRELQRESYGFFATGWLVFSYLILLQWHYIARREAAKNAV
ncbi:MAG: hypothetical protein KF686_18830, partial [Ramlibacter sp.]|nr:hypothetical protein [Ramlibacter sp.]